MFIDADKAMNRGIIGKIKVTINGDLIPHAIAAKHGKNGFVEFLKYPIKIINDEIVYSKRRGNVKISLNLA